MQMNRLDAYAAKELIKESNSFLKEVSSMDAVATTGAGALNSLYTYFDPKVIRTVYADVPYAKGEVIAISNDIPAWADKVAYQRIDRTGLYGRVDVNSTRENTIALGTGDIQADVAYYSAAFRLNILEQRRKGAPNLAFDIEKEDLQALEEAAMETLNLILALGDTRIPGHLNHYDSHTLYLPYRLDNQPAGGVVSTDQQKYDGLMLGLRVFTESFGRFRANRIVAAHSVATDLSKSRLGSTNDTVPVFNTFASAYPDFKQGVTGVPQCIGAGRPGANNINNDVVVIFNDSPTIAEGKVTMKPQIFPYQLRGLQMHCYGIFGTAGTILKQPTGHLTIEMPAAD